MLTKAKFLTAALLLAASASGALAQSQIGNGASSQLVQARGKRIYAVPHFKGAPSRQNGFNAYSNEVPFAPF
jgi:hypothetical protein